jgi:hypothetical protein
MPGTESHDTAAPDRRSFLKAGGALAIASAAQATWSQVGAGSSLPKLIAVEEAWACPDGSGCTIDE